MILVGACFVGMRVKIAHSEFPDTDSLIKYLLDLDFKDSEIDELIEGKTVSIEDEVFYCLIKGKTI